MTKLELAVVNNYLKWLELKTETFRYTINRLRGKWLLNKWQKTNRVTEKVAKEQIANLLLNVIYGMMEKGGK